MKPAIFLLMLLFFITACKKEEQQQAVFSEARYTVTVTGKWTAPAFTVPPGAHYTTFIGMVHNERALLWQEGDKATYGMEVLAETGGGGPVLAEIDSTIRTNNGLSLLLFVAPGTSTSANVNLYCNSNYSRVSFASMLGPTPDWFVGVNGVNLHRNGQWLADTTIDLYTLDAGTEEGNVFGYNNPSTVPQQNIQVLQAAQATILANGNPTLAPIASVRFRKN
ncbi:MAG: spondin domain-containing protein [Chitinophagaceae bacterium]|nr:spondin domain-containing protein [Chitinophagaceae bacterium]